jgi:hypothetical protein
MNSNSNCSVHDEISKYKQSQECNCKLPKGNKVIFESNYGNLGPLDVAFSAGESFISINLPIASVVIDTTCVNVKNVIIEFTGILNVTTTVAATSTLNFTLYSICNDMKVRQTLAMTSFLLSEQTGGITASHTLAFRFPLGDCNCNDCCSYELELSSIFNLDFGMITYQINGIISAMAIVSDR